MNNVIHRGGIVAAVFFLAASGSTAFAQDPATQPPHERNQGQQPAQQGMEQIGSAYRQLHDATLTVLRSQARSFGEGAKSGRAGTEREPGDTDRSSGAGESSPGSISLRSEELLIAACTEGLLAAAPTSAGMQPSTSQPSTSQPSTSQPSTSQPSTSQPSTGASGSDSHRESTPSTGASASGQTVGLLLVCAHTSNGSTRVGHASDERTDKQASDASSTGGSGTADASAAMGSLKPGTYAIKRAGNSVWLADQSGNVALRATIDSNNGQMPSRTEPSDRTGGRSEQGTEQRGEHGAMHQGSMHGNRDWGLVFGAITKEAMTSMGWSSHDRGATGR